MGGGGGIRECIEKEAQTDKLKREVGKRVHRGRDRRKHTQRGGMEESGSRRRETDKR